MPIKPEKRALYPKDWPAISQRIRFERAKGRCEQCGAPHGKVIARGEGEHRGTYMLADGTVHDASDGTRLGRARMSEYQSRWVAVVLTVAHLDHDPTNSSDDNLRALCQRCHLAYDAAHHAANAAATRRARRATGDLFTPASEGGDG